MGMPLLPMIWGVEAIGVARHKVSMCDAAMQAHGM